MSATGQPRRLSDLGMSVSPPTPDYRCDAAKRRFGPISDIERLVRNERSLQQRAASLLRRDAEQLTHQQEALGSIHLLRTEALFSATAARMRALNASSSIFSPS
jgi:hypothetical protein